MYGRYHREAVYGMKTHMPPCLLALLFQALLGCSSKSLALLLQLLPLSLIPHSPLLHASRQEVLEHLLAGIISVNCQGRGKWT